MLDSLRAFSRTWIAKIFFGVLIVSFAAWGISGVITGVGQTTVARVGAEDISVQEFQRTYTQQLEAISRERGILLTNEQALQYGIPGYVLYELTAISAVNQLGERMGIGVSDQRLGDMMNDDGRVAGTLGTYDPNAFKQVLQRYGYTEADYFEELRKTARSNQLSAGLIDGAPLPGAALELISRHDGDTRMIEYFVLSTMPSVGEPTDDELRAYLTEHQAEYRTTETRTVNVLVLSPETLAAKFVPTDEEIAAEYERTKASLGTAEKRTVRWAILPDQSAIDAFTGGEAAGKTFDQLVTETGVTVTDVGSVEATQIVDKSVANAAFGLAEAGDYVVIPGIGTSKRVVTISAKEGGQTPTLDEVKAEISQRLAISQARLGYLDALDQVEEARAAFEPLSQIATSMGVPVTEVTLSTAASELEAVAAIPETSRQQVATAIFAADPESRIAPTIPLSTTTNVFYDIVKTEAVRDQTLEEVRDGVLAAWTAEKTDIALKTEVDTMVAELKAGTPFGEVAAKYAQFVELAQGVGRNGNNNTAFDGTVAAEAFAGGVDHVGAVRNNSGDYLVFHVLGITPATEVSPAQQFIEAGARRSLFADFVTGVRNDAGVRENAQALNQLLNLTPGS